MQQEHHLLVRRTARYYTMGTLTDQTKTIWFCLHGFGQLAQYFGRKFTDLDDGQTLIVVPEGLSRLYLDGTYNRVGASWLTREDKQHEIEDGLAYLNALYDSLLIGRDATRFSINILGFSQGAAVACRWVGTGHIRVDKLILWAGYFPNGFHDLINPTKLATIDTHYVYGRQDEYITQMDDAQGYLNRIQTDVPGLHMTAFEGGHRVEPAVLQALLSGSEVAP